MHQKVVSDFGHQRFFHKEKRSVLFFSSRLIRPPGARRPSSCPVLHSHQPCPAIWTANSGKDFEEDVSDERMQEI